MMKSCSKCIHFEPRTKFCRVDPPVPITEEHHTRSKWPVIMRPESDFCGRFVLIHELRAVQNIESNQITIPETELIKG